MAKRLQHDAEMFLAHPIGIKALLRQRPGVLFDHDGELHLQRFANASGPRLADEEIGEMHEVGYLGSKSLDRNRKTCSQTPQTVRELLIASADEDHLDVGLDRTGDS